METKYKLYIVSFSDSKKYRLEVINGDLSALVAVEERLKKYLKTLFPNGSYTYYTTPKLTEISWEHRDQYAGYPELNDKAVQEIEEELKKEVRVENSVHALDRDAPWSQIK